MLIAIIVTLSLSTVVGFLILGENVKKDGGNNIFSGWRMKTKYEKYLGKDNMRLYENKEGRDKHIDYVRKYDMPIVIDGIISKEFSLVIEYHDITFGSKTSSTEVTISIIRNSKSVYMYNTTHETMKTYPTIPILVNRKESFVYEKLLIHHIANSSKPEDIVNAILKEQLRYKNKRE